MYEVVGAHLLMASTSYGGDGRYVMCGGAHAGGVVKTRWRHRRFLIQKCTYTQNTHTVHNILTLHTRLIAYFVGTDVF